MNNLYIMNLAIADFIIGLVLGTNNHMIIITDHNHVITTWSGYILTNTSYDNILWHRHLGQYCDC